MKFLLLSVLFLCLSGGSLVKAAPPVSGSTGQSVPEICTAADNTSLTLPETARCGQPVRLSVILPEAAAGAFPHVRLDWLERPAGKAPDVLTGVPETDITFHVAGQYRCRVRAGYMVRTS